MEPPEITSSEPGSFTWRVLHQRHPAIIAQLHAAHDLDQWQSAVLGELADEYTSGAWDDRPFLRAEHAFYHRIVAAFGDIDPFAPMKAAELSSPGLDEDLATAPDDLGGLLLAAVWGNQADLSFRLQAGTAGASAAPGGLVRDDRAAAVELLSAGTPRVALLADNSGRELAADLLLLAYLLRHGLAGTVELHVKPCPYFVSDATAADVADTLARLAAAGSPAAADLASAAADGRFLVLTHDFHAAAEPYRQMPADLAERLAGAGLAIVKGDLNYRRLVQDRLWPPATGFGEVTGYFPTAVLALRTLKSEVVTGLSPATVTALDATGEPWRITGRHGLVQFRPAAQVG